MKHHKSCACEKCDTGEPRPYPVSRYPIFENPTVLLPNVENQPGDMKRPTISTIQEAFLSAAPRQAFLDLLRQQPELVNEVGFNGQQPLHKAALRGDPDLIETLLQFGADVHARTNYLETPLHFACKRGSPRVIHMLIEAGADVEAVDKSGKSMAHHAVQGGSVIAMHYLSEICGQDFNHRDFFFILPIHLAALHGQKEAFLYLTRKGRSDLYARDGQENSCLHLAAQGGHEYLCWLLLEMGSRSMLHQQNNLGFTPLDVAKMGQNPKHKEIALWLSFYARSQARDGPVRGPVMAWWLHLFVGPVLFPLFLIVSQVCPQKGWVMLVGLPAMAAILYGHGHRMNHVCRWPNPIHAGVFAAGFFHTMACSYIELLPHIYLQWPKSTGFAFVSTLVMLYQYYHLVRRNPGLVRESERKEGVNEAYGIRDIATGLIRPESLCPDCELVPPPRSHHCKICNKCYYDLDHHCLFLYACVARHTHRLFILFLAAVQVSMIHFILMALVYFGALYPQAENYWAAASWAFCNCPWVGSLVLLNLASLGWGFMLLKYQLEVISRGHTTAYQPAQGRTNLTYRQRLENIGNFFAGRKVTAGDPIVVS